MIENEKNDKLVITEKMISDFLKSVGAPVTENCPKCKNPTWNEDGNPDAVIMSVDKDKAKTHSSVLNINCSTCGFRENYQTHAMVQYWLSKHED